MNYIANASLLIVETLLGLYLYIVLLRFWMQWVRADFLNPLGQFILGVTNPIVLPLRRAIPPAGTIDTATLLFAFVCALVKTWAVLALLGAHPPVFDLLIFGFSELLRSSVHLFIASLIVVIIASWIASGSYHPIVYVAHQLAQPIMAPARRILPPIGGLDLSPILVFLFLQVTLALLIAPISPFI